MCSTSNILPGVNSNSLTDSLDSPKCTRPRCNCIINQCNCSGKLALLISGGKYLLNSPDKFVSASRFKYCDMSDKYLFFS
jgi:hypothetical protein